MAINDDDLELDSEAETDSKPSNKKKIIIFAVVGILVVGLAVGATLFFTGVIGGDATTEVSEESATEDAAEEETAEAEVPTDTVYHKFKPAFVVNFEDKGKLRFLQVDLSVSTKLPSVIDALVKHEPVIRNNLVLLYSSKKAGELNSIEGKELLRTETREAIQQIMKDNIGNTGIDEVFFTGFVVQ
ncbi:MAG: flagellar basal body-associated FliL family protein [Sulfuriflexus sp.]|nr:flagellar basal body-associated FliL family protein [Sulfuriflexus sp.]